MPPPRLANVFRWPAVRHSLPSHRSLGLRTTRAACYSAVSAPPRCEHFDVPCRSNGSIKIDVYHATTPSAPVVVYLPSGPVIPDCSGEEEGVITLLQASTAATIVCINYRASAIHQYPTPYHDVLFGYDWIRENLLRDDFERPYLARLGVCGQLVGGSLATMLALTESRVGESRFGAAAVNNPIVDWVFPDELPVVNPSDLPEPAAPDETEFPADADLAGSWSVPDVEQEHVKPVRKRQKRTPKAPPLTSWQAHGHDKILPSLTLAAERDVLFRRPEHYFDRFASPIHFFRSPHAQLIFPPQDDVEASFRADDLIDIETQLSLNHYAAFGDHSKTMPVLPTLARCRAYARLYPPAGARLSLPAWNITSGLNSPLYDQTTELARMIRRSIARYTLKLHSGRGRWHDAAEKKHYEEVAQERVQLNEYQGIGLWSEQDAKSDWKAHVEETGAWMKRCLEPDFS